MFSVIIPSTFPTYLYCAYYLLTPIYLRPEIPSQNIVTTARLLLVSVA